MLGGQEVQARWNVRDLVRTQLESKANQRAEPLSVDDAKQPTGLHGKPIHKRFREHNRRNWRTCQR